MDYYQPSSFSLSDLGPTLVAFWARINDFSAGGIYIHMSRFNVPNRAKVVSNNLFFINQHLASRFSLMIQVGKVSFT